MPEPVGPTTATVRPGATSKVTSCEDGVVAVGEAQVRHGECRRDIDRAGSGHAVHLLALGGDDALHALVADDAARQLVEHPADGPDREGQQREQVGDADQRAAVEVAAADPRRADDQHEQHPDDRQRLHDRVEQAAHPADLDEGVAQLLGDGGEPGGLGRLAAERLDDQGTVEGLVRDGADLAAQLLRPRHQRRHPLL